MLDKTKKNLTAGIGRVKWIASYLTERTKAESSAAKLLYQRSKLESRRDDIWKNIGVRVAELHGKAEADVYGDFVIQQALSELKELQEKIDDYKSRARDMTKLREE
ncbi:MAG: hypothetical protein JSU90_06700 [Nitrospiraceae bacterium]|nr:MAG: hypothetical protein JSU90_06700 [Nitrospiraceae bacterium]